MTIFMYYYVLFQAHAYHIWFPARSSLDNLNQCCFSSYTGIGILLNNISKIIFTVRFGGATEVGVERKQIYSKLPLNELMLTQSPYALLVVMFICSVMLSSGCLHKKEQKKRSNLLYVIFLKLKLTSLLKNFHNCIHIVTFRQSIYFLAFTGISVF